MAYNAKYIHRFSDVYQNAPEQYEILIYKKDYAGSVYEVSCSGTPFVVETDRKGEKSYRPIISTVGTLNLLFNETLKVWDSIPTNWEDYTALWNVSDVEFDFSEFLNADADDFYLTLTRGGDLIWKGWYIPTSDVVISEIKPIGFTLKFSDFLLTKSSTYSADVDPALPPVQLATASFNSATIGSGASNPYNITFSSSTSSGLVIDSTTGGYYRIKNSTASSIFAKFKLNIDVDYSNLGIIDTVELFAIKSADASVTTATETQSVQYPVGAIDFGFLLPPSEGVRFMINMSTALGGAPSGSMQLLATSGVIAETVVDTTIPPIKYPAHEKISVLDLMLLSLISSRLDLEIRVATNYGFDYTYASFDEYGTIPIDLSTTYILKNSMMKNGSEYYSFFEILEGICNHFGLIAYQKNGFLYICDYNLLVNNSNRELSRYSYVDGSFIGNTTETDSDIALNSSSFKNIGQSQIATYSLPYKSVDIPNKTATASNQINAYLKTTIETPSTKYLEGWRLYGYATPNLAPNINFINLNFPYARIAAAPYNYRWGASAIYKTGTTQNDTRYIETDLSKNVNETQIGVKVSKGDYISVSTSFAYDARLIVANIPQTKVAVIIRYPDPANSANKITLYLNDVTKRFVTTPTYVSTINLSLYGISIPIDCEVFLRIVMPWSSYAGDNTVDPTIAPWLFINYAIIQTYKGDNSASQTYTTYTEGLNNNNNTQTLDSILYTFSNNLYLSEYTGLYESRPNGSPYAITNSIINEFYDFIPKPYTLTNANPADELVSSITTPIFRNVGFPSLSITGTYKSDLFSIGDKFTYNVSNLGETKFVLLDYRNDYKQASQDVILFSSEFTDTTDKTIITKLIGK